MVQTTTPTSPVIDCYYIVKTAAKKISAKGDAYLDMIFMNADGEIPAKLWDYKEGAHDWITGGIIVKVRGNEELWNDKKQFRIQRIRRVAEDDQVDMRALVPCAPFDGAAMLEQVQALVASFSDEPLRELVGRILSNNRVRLLICPAAVKLHHAICGGLLYHVLSVARLAEGVCGVYPFINRDLLLAGAILHDIAKLDELRVEDTGIAGGYTTQGELLGHLVMGAMIVRDAAKELGTPEETALLLEHMLISHHGIPEYGCAVRPMLLEAEILSMLDNLDATVNQITTSLDSVEPGGFGQKLWSLDQRKFYRPGYYSPENLSAAVIRPDAGKDDTEGM